MDGVDARCCRELAAANENDLAAIGRRAGVLALPPQRRELPKPRSIRTHDESGNRICVVKAFLDEIEGYPLTVRRRPRFAVKPSIWICRDPRQDGSRSLDEHE